MADVTPLKANIQSEEVDAFSGVTEATWNKIGSSVNFINDRQLDYYRFSGNGSPKASTFIDPSFIPFFDYSIVGVGMFVKTAGTSGTFEFDIQRQTSSGGALSSIFSTLPALTFSAGDNSYSLRRFTESDTLGNTANFTVPVLSTAASDGSFSLDAGDNLQIEITSVQASMRDIGIFFYMRPR